MNKLKVMLSKHRQLKFPEFPSSDEFSDWVSELTETDGYYFGLLGSLSQGGKVKLNNIALKQLQGRLEAFKDLAADHDIYLQCVAYLYSLDQLVSSAMSQSN